MATATKPAPASKAPPQVANKIGKYACGFCSTRHHTLCPGTTRNGSHAPALTVTCPCSASGHTLVPGAHLVAEIVRLPESALQALREARQAGLHAAGQAIELGGDAQASGSGQGLAPARARTRQRRSAAGTFPAGVVNPNQFTRQIAELGLCKWSPGQRIVYRWIATEPTFPVKYYGPDGRVSDTPGEGLRPGVQVADALVWAKARRS